MVHISLKEAARHDDHCIAYCGNHVCDHSARVDFAPLIARYGEDMSLDPIIGRLRCKLCGFRGATIRTASHDPERPPRPLYDPVTGERLGE